MIKIVNKEQYNHILKENNQLSLANKNLASVNGKTQKELENYKTKNQELEIDNAGLKDIINMQEKEISKLQLNNQETETNNKQLKDKTHRLSSEKGGYIKQNNKLRAKLDAKDRVINEYEKALRDLEEKNQNQLNTIKELTKKIEHKSIEYKNNGLSKQSKKAFKKGNK